LAMRWQFRRPLDAPDAPPWSSYVLAHTAPPGPVVGPFSAPVSPAPRGHDAVNVAHLGRHPRAFQHTALRWLYPSCAVRGCNQQMRLQWDHREAWKDVHETALQNIDGLCSYHHGMKTARGWMLTRGRGKRDFVAPTDPRHPKYRPRAAQDRTTTPGSAAMTASPTPSPEKTLTGRPGDSTTR
jgi:hypothetical protein